MANKKTKKKGVTRPSMMKTVKVKVIAEKFGTYVKGDVIEMHKTTADACIKNEVVAKVK